MAQRKMHLVLKGNENNTARRMVTGTVLTWFFVGAAIVCYPIFLPVPVQKALVWHLPG